MHIYVQYLGEYGQDITVTNRLEKDVISIEIQMFDDDIDPLDNHLSPEESEFIQIESYEVVKCYTRDIDMNSNPSLTKILNFLKNQHNIELDKI